MINITKMMRQSMKTVEMGINPKKNEGDGFYLSRPPTAQVQTTCASENSSPYFMLGRLPICFLSTSFCFLLRQSLRSPFLDLISASITCELLSVSYEITRMTSGNKRTTSPSTIHKHIVTFHRSHRIPESII